MAVEAAAVELKAAEAAEGAEAKASAAAAKRETEARPM
jgi:hypothetical protein